MEEDHWIQELEYNQHKHKIFYKSPVSSLQIHILRINQAKELISVKTYPYTLSTRNKISKNELIYLISQYKPKQYSLLDILVYQMTLSSDEIKNIADYDGLRSQTVIHDLLLEDVLDYFQDMNAIYFLFYEKNPSKHNTRRVHISKPTNKKYSRRMISRNQF